VRHRRAEAQELMSVDDFVSKIKSEIQTRSLTGFME